MCNRGPDFFVSFFFLFFNFSFCFLRRFSCKSQASDDLWLLPKPSSAQPGHIVSTPQYIVCWQVTPRSTFKKKTLFLL
ncbi:hypothetical protein BDV29DRAFT_184603 [Aspergillus leporis]|uniref:Uncharacterized protein n=1 Tax=Aspergillus leporis TaxID=41062 RepID=A0A5N5WIM7_9EURO|nr:hypothetical protein BDV29DRAFT_184603 [Aspergillus leporis]